MSFAEAILTGIAASLAAKTAVRGGEWLLVQSSVQKAIEDTARLEPPPRDDHLREALARWVEGGAFIALLIEIEDGAPDGAAERFAKSLKKHGRLAIADRDLSYSTKVVRAFARHLRARLLRDGRSDILYNVIQDNTERLTAGQQELLDGQRQMIRELARMNKSGEVAVTKAELDTIRSRLRQASRILVGWPRTLPTGDRIESPLLNEMIERMGSEPSSVTLIEGAPGVGKSALLAELGNRLQEEDVALLALKADMVPSDVARANDLVKEIPGGLVNAIQQLASREPVVVLLDQLDAVSSVVDLRSDRLNVLLDFVGRLHGIPGIHVVATVRPFERSVDARLQGAFAQSKELPVPEWTEVKKVLQAAGHNPEQIGPGLQDVLRVPAYLRVFLDVAEPGAMYSSWLQLYEVLWSKRVRAEPLASERVALVGKIVEWLSNEEELWAPSAIADDYPGALNQLLSADILMRESDDGRRIGFRHQTLFEFARARAFVRGEESLVDHVRARQDGLFVRPVIIAGLSALRELSASSYRSVLLKLLEDDIRDHIHTLVREFIARQSAPTTEEVDVLLPHLRDGTHGKRLLRLTAQSVRWFDVLLRTGVLEEWMQRPADEAYPASRPLIEAAKRGQGQEVFQLVERYWLRDPEYDLRALTVLDEIPSWTPAVARGVEPMLSRLDRTFRHHVVDVALNGDLPSAFRLLRKALDIDQKQELEEEYRRAERFSELRETLHPESAPLEKGASNREERSTVHFLRRGKARRRVLRGWHMWPDVAEKVKEDPEAFVSNAWPWFEEALRDESLIVPQGKWRYRGPWVDSAGESRDETILGVAGRMIESIAETDGDLFLDLAERLHLEDLRIVHQVLMRGYVMLAKSRPDKALEYLTGDPRRLVVGTYFDEISSTRMLIEALVPHLDDDRRKRLEDIIVAFDPDMPADTDPERWHEWVLRMRAQLMRAIPEGSGAFLAERAAAEKTLSDIPADTTPPAGVISIQSPLPAKVMSDLNDEELMTAISNVMTGQGHQVAKQYLDEVPHPAAIGGSDDMAVEFGKFARRSPLRARRMIDRMDRRHHLFVARALDGFTDTDAPEAEPIQQEMPSLVAELIGRNIDSHSLRCSAARALEHRYGGLPDDTLDLLETWFWGTEESDEAAYSSQEVDRSSSLLFDYRTWSIGNARHLFLYSIASGCVHRPNPSFDRWAALCELMLERGVGARTWSSAIGLTGRFFGAGRDEVRTRVTAIIRQAIRSVPEALAHAETLFGLSRLLPHLYKEGVALDLLEDIKNSGARCAHQVYGELLILYYAKTQDPGARERIQEIADDCETVDVLLGAAYASSHLWRLTDMKPLALQVLSAAALHSDSEVHAIPSRAFSILQRDNPSVLRKEDEDLVRIVVQNEDALRSAAESLVAMVAPRAGACPDLAVAVGRSVIALFEQEAPGPGSKLSLVEEDLTQLALTIHRLPDTKHRAAGLELFEAIYRLDFRSAREALLLLDRSPAA